MRGRWHDVTYIDVNTDMSTVEPPKPALTGTRTVAEIVQDDPQHIATYGKQSIEDIGMRVAQISGLKPGSSSIRTKAMINEILERLIMGQSLTAISFLKHMPARSTLAYWMRDDPVLRDDIRWAESEGQEVLADIRTNIAMKGIFASQDPRYDEMLIRAINVNIGQRNRARFGERQSVTVEHTLPSVVLPGIALPSANGIEDDDPEDDEGEG